MATIIERWFWVAFILFTCGLAAHWWRHAKRMMRRMPELEPGYRKLLRGYLIWMNLPWLAMGVGLLTGWVPSMEHLLRPSMEYPATILWDVLIVFELLMGAFWIFVQGGAEMLERHPGIQMVPMGPASTIRRYWLGLIGWVVASIGFGYLSNDFPAMAGVAAHGTEAEPFGLGFMLTFMLPFSAGTYLLGAYVTSVYSGWSALADPYRSDGSPSVERRWRLRAVRFNGSVAYNGLLGFRADAQGLQLRMGWFLRLFHPPLWIPWGDITLHDEGRFVDLEFAALPTASVLLERRLVDDFVEVSRGRLKWPS